MLLFIAHGLLNHEWLSQTAKASYHLTAIGTKLEQNYLLLTRPEMLQFSIVCTVVLHTMLCSFVYYTLYHALLLILFVVVNTLAVLYCFIHL